MTLLALHRLARRWNQTGQKHAGAPDIARSVLPESRSLLWSIIALTYVNLGSRLAQLSSLEKLAARATTSVVAILITVAAFIFKLSFTAQDAPELVQGPGRPVWSLLTLVSLAVHARVVFIGLFGCLAWLFYVRKARSNTRAARQGDNKTDIRNLHFHDTNHPGLHSGLAVDIHNVLSLLLVTQTRAQNIPLFLLFDFQRVLLCKVNPTWFPTWLFCFLKKLAKMLVAFIRLNTSQATLSMILLAHTAFFALGNSNAISSIDLSNAYNGVTGYNVLAVGILVFVSNWAGPIWWASATTLLLLDQDAPNTEDSTIARHENSTGGLRRWIAAERASLRLAVSADSSPSTGRPESPGISDSARPSKPALAKDSARADSSSSALTNSYIAHVALLTLFTSFSLLAVMVACTLLRTHLFIWTVFSPKYLYAMAWSLGFHFLVGIGVTGLLWWVGSGR